VNVFFQYLTHFTQSILRANPKQDKVGKSLLLLSSQTISKNAQPKPNLKSD